MYLGSAYWRFIHFFSLHDIDYEYIKQIVNFMPCEDCKLEWEDPVQDQDLIEWSMSLHNKINKKMGKYDKYDLTDFIICQKRHCDICAGDEHKNQYPWELIHFVAEKYGESSLEFLKRFNTLYPCDKCRSNLLIDDQHEGETVLNWTIRHHTRFNQFKGLPEFRYIVSDKTCVGCEESVVESTTIA